MMWTITDRETGEERIEALEPRRLEPE